MVTHEESKVGTTGKLGDLTLEDTRSLLNRHLGELIHGTISLLEVLVFVLAPPIVPLVMT